MALQGCSVDLSTGEVRGRQGASSLPPQQLRLLRWFVEHPHQVASRDRLHAEVWEFADSVVSRAADVAVGRLRAALEVDPRAPHHFTMVRGEGYCFVPLQQSTQTLADGSWPLAPVLVGRQATQDALERGVSPGLTSLVGAPGVGKTALLCWLGHTRESPAQCWFVQGTDLLDARGLEQAVIQAVFPAGGSSPSSFLPKAGRAMLGLDDVTHLPGAGALVEGWLRVAPQLTIVVTGRSRLGQSGERTIRVGPLSPQAAADLLAAETGEAPQAMAPLSAALDGLPSVLLSAAARCTLLTPQGLLERLARDPQTLSAPSTSVHHDMEAALARVWSALVDAERVVLSGCALFAGEIALDAAEGLLRSEVDVPVLDLLQRLVDVSLIEPRRGSEPIRLLQVVRRFSQARMDPQLRPRLTSAYGELVLGRAEGVLEGRVEGRGGMAFEIERHVADLLQVETWFDGELLGARATAALSPWRTNHLPLGEHLEVVDRAILVANGHPLCLARLGCVRAYLLVAGARLVEARQQIGSVLAGPSTDWHPCAQLLGLAVDGAEWTVDRPDERHRPVVEVLMATGRERWEMEARALWASAARQAGELDSARRQSRALAARARTTGERNYEARAHLELARVAMWQRRLEDALTACDAAVVCLADEPGRRYEAQAYEVRGEVHVHRRDPALALEDYDRALVLGAQNDPRRWTAQLLVKRMQPLCGLGRVEDAREAGEDALALALAQGDGWLEAQARLELAVLDLAEGAVAPAIAGLQGARTAEGRHDRLRIGLSWLYEAVAESRRGDAVAAQAAFMQAERVSAAVGWPPMFEMVACVEVYLGAAAGELAAEAVRCRLEEAMAAEQQVETMARLMLTGLAAARP